MKIFALNDSKLGEFGQPFFFHARGQAVRFLSDLTRDPKTQVCQHPEDFRLYLLGEYDPASGIFTNIDGAPEFIAAAADFAEGKPNGKP